MNGLIKSEATRGRGGGTKGEWQEMAEIWDFFRVPKGSTAELPTKAGKRTEQIIIQRAQVELRAGEWVLGFVFCVGKAPSYVQFRDGQVTAYLSCKLIKGFQCVAAPLHNGLFAGCTTGNARCPLFSNSTHVCEGASRARFISLDDYHFTDCLGWDSAQSILATVFEN